MSATSTRTATEAATTERPAGEVAVRTGTNVTALEADGLEGKRLEVDLGTDDPVVRIPEEVAVEYNDTTTDAYALDVEPTTASLRGFTLDDSQVDLVLFAAGLLIASGGYLWGTEEALLGLIVAGVGALVGRLGVLARAGGNA